MRKADNPYYLRDSKGHEVDVLLDYGSYVDMIEIQQTTKQQKGSSLCLTLIV